MDNKRIIYLTIFTYRDKSAPDKYTSHCLQLDIVSTDDFIDDSIREAEELSVQAVAYAQEKDNYTHLFKWAPDEVLAEYMENAISRNHLMETRLVGIRNLNPIELRFSFAECLLK